MNRSLAFFLALMFASIIVSSACVARRRDWIRFSLEAERGGGKIHANFQRR